MLALLKDVIDESGLELVSGGADEIAQYTSDRAAHLSLIVGQPGFEEAVRAERDNVMLMAASTIVRRGDAADALLRERLLGLVQGGLAIGAKLLTVA